MASQLSNMTNASVGCPSRTEKNSARRDDEPVPLRRPRRCGRGVLVLARATRSLPAPCLARAPRPCRPRARVATPARRRARDARGRGIGRRARARDRGEDRARDDDRTARAVGRGAARPRRRATPALRPWTRASPARRAHDRRVRGKRRRRSRARRRGSLLPLAERAGATVNELALAAFAAAYDAHATDREARSQRFARFAASFDADGYVRALSGRGLRWLARSDAAFPPRLRAIHDPPPGLFLRGEAEPELLARASVAVVGARSCTDYGAHVARQLG